MNPSDVPGNHPVQPLLRSMHGQRAAHVLSVCLEVAASSDTTKEIK